MSALQELGGCLWKLFQLGIVVAILVLGFLFISRPQEAPGAGRGETKAGAAVDRGKKAPAEGGLIAKLRNLGRANAERKKNEVDTMEQAGGGPPKGGVVVSAEESRLLASQEEVGTGHADLAKLLEWMDDKHVRRETGMLADGTTGIEQMVFWQIVDGNVHYRIVLQPYDRKAHELMMDPGEALFMSFLSGDQKRLVPKSADQRIEMRTLRVATREGYAVGWFYDGRLPLGGVDPAAVDRGRVGWVFSSGLHDRLREIQAPRKQVGTAAKSPFGIDLPVNGGKSPGSE